MKFLRIIYWIILLGLVSILSSNKPKDKEISSIGSSNNGVFIYVSPDYTFVEPEDEDDGIDAAIAEQSKLPEPVRPPERKKPIERPGEKPSIIPQEKAESQEPIIPKAEERPADNKVPFAKPGVMGIQPGDKLYIRIFKRERKLEIWYQRGRGAYRWYKSYDICTYSGGLGPKKLVGDHKSQEGFYSTSKGRLNPHSNYYKSFNLGYPNKYDRAHGYTGNYLMVHGSCVSVGCYAMTDAGIDEIYRIVEFALNNGQKEIPIHIFPFAMTEKNLNEHSNSQYIDFWREIKPGYDIFQQQRRVPQVTVKDKKYVIQ